MWGGGVGVRIRMGSWCGRAVKLGWVRWNVCVCVCVCVGGGGSNSKNRPSHHEYMSPKQFLCLAYLGTSEHVTNRQLSLASPITGLKFRRVAIQKSNVVRLKIPSKKTTRQCKYVVKTAKFKQFISPKIQVFTDKWQNWWVEKNGTRHMGKKKHYSTQNELTMNQEKLDLLFSRGTQKSWKLYSCRNSIHKNTHMSQVPAKVAAVITSIYLARHQAQLMSQKNAV